MRKFWLWAIALLIAIVVVMVLSARRTGEPTGVDPVAAAKTRFEEVRAEGIDLSAGPCLGIIAPGWVADIAHDPREPADDDPANQCEEYRTGQVKRFVELTPEGKLIRQR